MQIWIFRLIVGIIFLIYASYKDIKTRRIPDKLWIILGGIAFTILEVELIMNDAVWEHQIIVIPTAIIFFAVFFGEEMWTEQGFRLMPIRAMLYIVSVVLILYSVYHFSTGNRPNSSLFWAHFSMPILLVLAHLFYQLGLLRGGADAKAFMSIALLVPVYPNLVEGLPLIQLPVPGETVNLMFPFAFVVLLNATLLLLVLPISLFILNAIRRDLHGLESFVGYRVDLEKLPKFVWLMDKIEEGEHVRILLPKKRENREEQVRRLREKGFTRVWVTPQIPFILPLMVGFLSAFFIGNFIVGIIQLII